MRAIGVRVLIAAVLALGMAGMQEAAPVAHAATTRDIGCPTYSSLLSALGTAGSGDTLKMECPTPTTVVFTGVVGITTSVTLDASGSPAPITFDSGFAHQFFSVSSGVTFSLNSLTVERGKAIGRDGGAINNSGTLLINNSTFTDNHADDSGSNGDHHRQHLYRQLGQLLRRRHLRR
jgi:hypothetical protein